MRQEQVREQAVDADLAARATAGESAAFEELYRRHVESAWRVALAVTNNPHDAADAVSDAFTRVFQALPKRPQAARHFLPYLLAAVRNAGIDGLRRSARWRADGGGDPVDCASLGPGPGDRLEADTEAVLVTSAFRNLPERWRSVLWLTEVEGIPARDVAVLLNMTPNGVAQLAARARAGLRQRYLQAHLRPSEVRTTCRDTVNRLGAYAAGGLAPRDIARVDQHLAGCEACRSRLAQLQDLAPTLRRAVLPLPAVLVAMAAARLDLAVGGATTGAAASAAVAAPTGIGAGASLLAALVPAPLVAAVASAALFAAGLMGAGAVQRSQRPTSPVPVVAPVPATATFSSATAPAPAPTPPSTDPATGLSDDTARAAAAARPADVADLLARLGRGRADLPATLATASQGHVHFDVGAEAAGVDLREGAPACPTVRVLGVHVGCRPADPAVTPPTSPAATDAPKQLLPLPDGLMDAPAP